MGGSEGDVVEDSRTKVTGGKDCVANLGNAVEEKGPRKKKKKK